MAPTTSSTAASCQGPLGGHVPLLVSAGLVAWLFWRFSFHDVLSAALQLPWQWLLPLTAGMVLALYAWDGLCLPATYGMEHSPLCYLSAYGRGACPIS